MSAFWNVILSLAVGITSGLAVQPIQRWWEKRATSSQSKRHKRIAEEYAAATYYALHPEFLVCKLVLTCTGVMGFAIYLLCLIKIDVTPVHPGLFPKPAFRVPEYVPTLLDVGQMLFIIVVAIFIGRTTINAFYLFERVRGFRFYVEKVPSKLRDVSMEKVVIAIVKGRPLSVLSDLGIEELSTSIEKSREEGGTNEKEPS
jgi:hypothetical protein